MVTIERVKYGISISETYFASTADISSSPATIHFFVQAKEPFQGASPFQTLIVDLGGTETEILDGYSRNTRCKIKRAEKEGLLTQINFSPSNSDIVDFVRFISQLGDVHQLPNRRKLFALEHVEGLVLSFVANQGGEVLAVHALVQDHVLKRARLLYSGSLFQCGGVESVERNFIGRANRYLHWREMIALKQQGFLHYDFGGFAAGAASEKLANIAKFKRGFGGRKVIEYTGMRPGNCLGRAILLLTRNRQ